MPQLHSLGAVYCCQLLACYCWRIPQSPTSALGKERKKNWGQKRKRVTVVAVAQAERTLLLLMAVLHAGQL
jgi:hypothetical protein